MLHNIDSKRQIAALRVGDYKLVRGNSYGGEWDGWYGPAGRGKDEAPGYNLTQVQSD